MMRKKMIFLGFLWITMLQEQGNAKTFILREQEYKQLLPVSSEEMTSFRKQGPTGVIDYLQKYQTHLQGPSANLYQFALDQICQQKDCFSSRLYWYTDLEQAKKIALQEGKPILSLRLLGDLSTDLSCANSRFFRTTLYSNTLISHFLRENFILHWQSVRPVPIVTIDFGDGRTLKQTITGNSIHYVLNGHGQVIDALPGLYGSQAFLQQLQQAHQVTHELAKLRKSQDIFKQRGYLEKYYQTRIKNIEQSWKTDLQTLQIKQPEGLKPGFIKEPSAEEAATLAMSKSIVERPILREIRTSAENQMLLEKITDETAWKQIASLHLKDAKIDTNSVHLIERKMKNKTDTPPKPAILSSLVSTLEESISLDTVRNTYLFQPKIYSWLLENQTTSIDQLNERIYSELFLTPSSDPWLGLKPSAYSALDFDGMKF